MTVMMTEPTPTTIDPALASPGSSPVRRAARLEIGLALVAAAAVGIAALVLWRTHGAAVFLAYAEAAWALCF